MEVVCCLCGYFERVTDSFAHDIDVFLLDVTCNMSEAVVTRSVNMRPSLKINPPHEYERVQVAETQSPVRSTPKSPKSKDISATAKVATMFTYELPLHMAIVTLAMLAMMRAVVVASQEGSPGFESLRPRLSASWMPIKGLLVDDSDMQYRGFRSTLGVLISIMFAHVSVSLLAQKFAKRKPGDSSYLPRLVVSLLFSAIFLSVYIGVSGLLKLVCVLAVNFLVATNLKGSRAVPAFAWIYGLGVLFATNHYQGFSFGSLSSYLSFLDNLGGGMSRWWLPLRFVMLKMISFDMDSYWRYRKGNLENHVDICRECGKGGKADPFCPKGRLEISHLPEDYGFLHYIAYITYVPLYIAGPIIAYNDFISQLKNRTPFTTNGKALATYTARWIACFLTMEIFIHYAYVIAIAKSDAWKEMSAFELACLCFFNLKHVWLKLLVMWRFFRLWALFDGIETVENMNRCMTNNYSASGFWRSWHRSFNRWIIRYIYVPLGGSSCYMINLLITFTFVAVWHDLDLNLLAWGWLVSLFIIPEHLALRAFPAKVWGSWPYYKYLCGAGAVANILLMITVNIIGFGAIGGNGGIQGMMDALPRIFNANS
ncbi:glycerol transporter [Chytriomyces hyalinus]|nr:glycerol transporter [Chytriomyces hyalinus]